MDVTFLDMPYVVVAVETRTSWSSNETALTFEGQTLTLRPGSGSLYPTIYTKYDEDTQEAFAKQVSLIRRFLSALAWTEQSLIREVMTGGGGFPVNLGRAHEIPERTDSRVTGGGWHLRREYLPEATSQPARLGLALYREALGLEYDRSTPFAFLGYAKILNIGLANGKSQIAWINDAAVKLKDHRAVERLSEIRKTETDIGAYLYASGRCAVAHAYGEPTVDPDDAADTFRIVQDLPVAKALAAHFIEIELGIKSLNTIYSEHLYELDGFRALFGPELVAGLKKMARCRKP